MKRKNEMTLGEGLIYWMKSTGIEQKIFEQELKQTWDSVMGESISTQTKKIELIKDKATFYILSPVIKHDFNLKKEKIKQSLNEKLNHFKLLDIEFKS